MPPTDFTPEEGQVLAVVDPATNQRLAVKGVNNGDGTASLSLAVPTGLTATQASATAPVVATAGTVVKGSPGRLFFVTVTALGTAAVNIYDNAAAASGTVLLAIPASAPVGSVYTLNAPAANGIYVGGVASGPTITVGYA